MKAKVVLSIAAVCLAAAAVCFAADAFTDTWKLNASKSKAPAGVQRNETVTYEEVGDSVKVTLDGIGADGKPAHDVWTGKYDGKDYPVTGNPNNDARSYKKIDDHTLEITGKKDGQVVLTARVTVSADGKTRTVVVTQTGADGKKATSTAVYDKQ